MKIILDLSKSYNNYEWKNKNILKDFIENAIKKELWSLYNRDIEEDILTDEEHNRLYDILDIFEKYEVKE